MMTYEKPNRDANTEGAIIRALSSITPKQADIIAEAVSTAHQKWEVQTSDDYNGYLSILIGPSVIDDQQKSFFVAGVAQRLELFEAYNDDMTSLGSFDDAEALSKQLLKFLDKR